MHAVGGRHLGVGEDACHGLVGQQHRLLHKPRRSRPVAHAHACGMALIVENDLGLARLEVDGSPGAAGALPQVPDAVEHAKHRGDGIRLGSVDARQFGRRDRAREQPVHLVVAQARVRADRRGAGLGRDDGTPGVQPHAHRHGQPVLPRTQRAHVVAQALREHRDHAVHKVDRAGARPRLEVHRGAPGQVMGNVGNVDVEVKAPVGALAGTDGVVEVTGVGRVDGHAHDVAQVGAARVRGERVAHAGAHALCLCERRRAELVGQAVARDDGLDVHVELGGRSHAPIDGHDGGGVGRRVLDDARRDDIPRHNAQTLGASVLRHDKEVVAKAVVERDHGAQGPRDLEAPEQRVGRPRDYGVDHGALSAATPATDDVDADLVAAHGLADPGSRHLEGALRRLDHGRPRAQHAQRARNGPALFARPLRRAAPVVSLVRSLTRHGLLPNQAGRREGAGKVVTTLTAPLYENGPRGYRGPRLANLCRLARP